MAELKFRLNDYLPALPSIICSGRVISTPIKDDTLNGRPETALFDAVLGRSLTVVGLGVTCTKHSPQTTPFAATFASG